MSDFHKVKQIQWCNRTVNFFFTEDSDYVKAHVKLTVVVDTEELIDKTVGTKFDFFGGAKYEKSNPIAEQELLNQALQNLKENILWHLTGKAVLHLREELKKTEEQQTVASGLLKDLDLPLSELQTHFDQKK